MVFFKIKLKFWVIVHKWVSKKTSYWLLFPNSQPTHVTSTLAQMLLLSFIIIADFSLSSSFHAWALFSFYSFFFISFFFFFFFFLFFSQVSEVTPLLLQFYFQLFCQSWEGQIVRDERESRSYSTPIKFKKGK